MKVAIVGGGLAGLLTAARLIDRGVDDLVVLEREGSPGGVASSVHVDGFRIEPAVSSFLLPDPGLSPLLEMLGVASDPVANSGRYVYGPHGLLELPQSPALIASPVLGPVAKARALSEPLVRSTSAPEETLDQFARRRFGEDAGSLIGWLMATGVFAGDPSDLSVAAAFPGMVELERRFGSVLRGALARRRSGDAARRRAHVVDGGVAALVDACSRLLDDRLVTSFEATGVKSTDGRWEVTGGGVIESEHLVLATGAVAASRLFDVEIGGLLAAERRSPVSIVGIGGRGADPLPGFGVLVGPGAHMKTRGITLESSYAPQTAPQGSYLIRAIVSPHRSERFAGVDTDPADDVPAEEVLAEEIVREVEVILGTRLDPNLVKIVHHLPGIPQYLVGHVEWLEAIDEALTRSPGLHIAGWSYRGVGVSQLAADAVRIAEKVTGR